MNFNILMAVLWGVLLIVSIISKEDIEYILHAGLWTLSNVFDVIKPFVNAPITCISYFILFAMGVIMTYMWCRRARYVGKEAERKTAILFAVLDVFFVLIYIGNFLVSIV